MKIDLPIDQMLKNMSNDMDNAGIPDPYIRGVLDTTMICTMLGAAIKPVYPDKHFEVHWTNDGIEVVMSLKKYRLTISSE